MKTVQLHYLGTSSDNRETQGNGKPKVLASHHDLLSDDPTLWGFDVWNAAQALSQPGDWRPGPA